MMSSATSTTPKTDSPKFGIAKYYYDPFGRRLWKEANGARTYYHYADEGLVAEMDTSGNITKSYGWKPDSTWGTDPLFMKTSEEYYFYHNDHLGTPQKITDLSGAVAWSATYSSFGKANVEPDSTVVNNLRFPGQYFDSETGLYWNWFRYYNSGVGRYVSDDPIGFLGSGVNLYAYVLNDPVNLIDPLGLLDAGDLNWMSSAMSSNYRSPGPAREIPIQAINNAITNPISWAIITKGTKNLVKGTKLTIPVGIGMEILGKILGPTDISDSTLPDDMNTNEMPDITDYNSPDICK